MVGGHHLTDNNTVTGNPGALGLASQFTQANGEYLSCPSTSLLKANNTDFTAMAHFYSDGFVGHDAVMSKRDGAFEWQMHAETSTGNKMRGHTLGGGLLTLDSTITLSTSTWYQVLYWLDRASSLLCMRVNTQTSFQTTPDTLATGGDSPGDTSAQFQIGSDGTGNVFNGRIQRCGFWRRMLSEVEQRQLWNGGQFVDWPLLPGRAV